MADNYLSGKNGYVLIGATNYSFDEWSAPMKAGLPKVTNFTTGGYRKQVVGILEGTVNIKGPYNQGNMPFTVGGSYTWHLGYTNGIELVVTGYIESITPTVNVEDAEKVAIVVQSDGSFTAAIT